MTVASQTLLSLVVQLQQVMSVAQGRTMLLDYARKICGARLALLFALDREQEILTLLTQSGRAPQATSSSSEHAPAEIPLQGLFASVLRRGGSLDIPDISQNTLSLPEERSWAWPHSRVLLYALRQGWQQGVLVFCFSPAGSRTRATSTTHEELLICVSLLSAYLAREVGFHFAPETSAKRAEETATSLNESKTEQKSEQPATDPLSFAEIANGLTILSEMGLVVGTQWEKQELLQRILQLLTTTLHAAASYLWLYQPDQQMFQLQASTGKLDAFVDYAAAELLSLVTAPPTAGRAATSGLITSESAGSGLVWHALSYHAHLSGAFGLILAPEAALSPEQRIFLAAASEIIAMILIHHDARLREHLTLIEQEQNRIAREIHDSVVQDVAHATQKLDHIQHILEKQPQVALHELEYTRTILTRSLRDLRDGISSLLPIPLAEQNFDEALEALIHEYSQSSSHFKVVYDRENLALWPQALQASIYRFMQEALNNIRKHAAASEVQIHIRCMASLGIVQISDNGNGFVPSQVRRNLSATSEGAIPHLGLLNMDERVRQAGGKLEIHSKPGEGTTLKARFPLSQSATLLTMREREVLRLLMEGLTNRAISERLSVSIETVKSHVHHIMQKMHVRDRTQAAVVATRQQWLQ